MLFQVQLDELRYNKVRKRGYSAVSVQTGGQLPTMQLIIIFVLFSLLSMFFIEELSHQLIKINNPEVGAGCEPVSPGLLGLYFIGTPKTKWD